MMSKVFSIRLDDSVVRKIERLSRQLRTTKKAVIEAAIDHYSEQIDKDQFSDILRETCGSWKRTELL